MEFFMCQVLLWGTLSEARATAWEEAYSGNPIAQIVLVQYPHVAEEVIANMVYEYLLTYGEV